MIKQKDYKMKECWMNALCIESYMISMKKYIEFGHMKRINEDQFTKQLSVKVIKVSCKPEDLMQTGRFVKKV